MSFFHFRDDYSDGGHPEILAALTHGSSSVQTAYGEDKHTSNARNLIREKMKAPGAAVHFVASGTLANIVAIASCLRPHEAVIAPSSGHIVVRETGAIEALGHKIITVPPVNGKLTVAGIQKALAENALFGEAIVISNPAFQEDISFHIKHRGALLSKGRALGIQFETLFESDLFYKLASNANIMAKALSEGIQQAGYTLAQPTKTNQVFAIFPDSLIAKLEKTSSFYVWENLDGGNSVIRLVTSWATKSTDIAGFITLI